MSRIHEALKKAAQERSPQPAAMLQPGVVEIAQKIVPPVLAEPDATRVAEQWRAARGSGREGFVKYEELVKRCAHPIWRIDPLTSVFRNPNVATGMAERFRTLRSRLYEAAAKRTLRRLLVTSSVPAEGKTFVVANLAQSIVQQPERRVLLIDADLRSPRLHVFFGAPGHPGLSEYLRGKADACDIIQKGLQENLCLIPAGTQASNPSELLLTEKFKYLLNSLTPLFDWIIIDSPPALQVHDAIDVAGLTDGVLLVLRAGATHVLAAEKVAVEFKAKNLLGVVLNQVTKGDSYGEYYYSDRSEAVAVGA